MKKNKKSKKKINKTRVFTFLVILFLIVIIGYIVYSTNITNIKIRGNIFYNDQQIIDIAGIKDYPKSISNTSFNIEKKLNNDKYIMESHVKKNIFLNKVVIEVKENYPLFYYSSIDKTILYNGDKIDDKYFNLTVINRIPDTVYDKFISKLREININILNRMSEIEYKPNEVDNERFLIFMNDGNQVYINISRFKNINKYIDILSLFEGKKGILYLDSGEYFVVYDE